MRQDVMSTTTVNNMQRRRRIALLSSQSFSKQMLKNVQVHSCRRCLLRNFGTSKLNTKISLNREILQEVESFVYLGSVFTRDGS